VGALSHYGHIPETGNDFSASKLNHQPRKGEEKQENKLNLGHNQALRLG